MLQKSNCVMTAKPLLDKGTSELYTSAPFPVLVNALVVRTYSILPLIAFRTAPFSCVIATYTNWKWPLSIAHSVTPGMRPSTIHDIIVTSSQWFNHVIGQSTLLLLHKLFGIVVYDVTMTYRPMGLLLQAVFFTSADWAWTWSVRELLSLCRFSI